MRRERRCGNHRSTHDRRWPGKRPAANPLVSNSQPLPRRFVLGAPGPSRHAGRFRAAGLMSRIEPCAGWWSGPPGTALNVSGRRNSGTGQDACGPSIRNAANVGEWKMSGCYVRAAGRVVAIPSSGPPFQAVDHVERPVVSRDGPSGSVRIRCWRARLPGRVCRAGEVIRSRSRHPRSSTMVEATAHA